MWARFSLFFWVFVKGMGIGSISLSRGWVKVVSRSKGLLSLLWRDWRYVDQMTAALLAEQDMGSKVKGNKEKALFIKTMMGKKNCLRIVFEMVLYGMNTILLFFVADQSRSKLQHRSEDRLWCEEGGAAQCPETAQHQVGSSAAAAAEAQCSAVQRSAA